MIVVFANVIRVTLLVSITIEMLRSVGTRERRTCSSPNLLLETNEYCSGPIS
jgi:hypothetical protein